MCNTMECVRSVDTTNSVYHQPWGGGGGGGGGGGPYRCIFSISSLHEPKVTDNQIRSHDSSSDHMILHRFIPLKVAYM